MDNQLYRTDYPLPSEQELAKQLSAVKVSMFLLDHGAVFLTTIMNNLSFHWDESIPTAQTDGLSISWNPYFFLALSKNMRLFVLVHEVWHCAYEHVSRFRGKDPLIANIAADIVINNDLIERGFKFDDEVIKILRDPEYSKMTFEQVYESLIKKHPPQTPQSNKHLERQMVEAGGSDVVVDTQDKSKAERMNKLIGAYTLSKMSNEHGVIPGDIKTIIDDFLNPILPWETLLQNYFNDLSNSDYSYRKPSRRYSDVIVPTLVSDGKLEVINYYIDVSGSVTNGMIRRFNSEIAYIKETYEPELIHIVQFDSRITKADVLEDSDSFNSIEIIGRGGTNLEPVYNHILKTEPKVSIIFSDLKCKKMKREPPCSVIWCVFNNPKANTDFGHVIHVVEDKVV